MQGYAPAQGSVGVMYDEGQGVPQDRKVANSWYEKAAEQGNAQGQFNLGLSYAQGQGVAPDLLEAHKWLNLAASHGNGSAGNPVPL